MLRITIRDRKNSAWIREQTKIKDIIQFTRQQKWRWAGHIARREDNRWNKRLMEWCPLDCKRSRKRPETRWRDDIKEFACRTWQRKARDRKLWKEM